MTEDPSYQPAPEDRPGGFQWGQVGMTFAVLLALLTMNHDEFWHWQMLVLCSFHTCVHQAGDGDAEGEEEEEEE